MRRQESSERPTGVHRIAMTRNTTCEGLHPAGTVTTPAVRHEWTSLEPHMARPWMIVNQTRCQSSNECNADQTSDYNSLRPSLLIPSPFSTLV
mmetsp:Transcript_5255/g.10738  ORF Transcript_5255/g.10738 Transcript_5255/m.10738 type:complete len:93 (+) Transcript_5255:178-456(+)